MLVGHLRSGSKTESNPWKANSVCKTGSMESPGIIDLGSTWPMVQDSLRGLDEAGDMFKKLGS